LAIGSYFEEADEAQDIGIPERLSPDPVLVPVPVPAMSSDQPASSSSGGGGGGGGKKKGGNAGRTTGIATLGSLRKKEEDDDDSDEHKDQEAFFAGGSVRSGQQVLGPAKKKDIVADMFKAAKEHGGEVVDPSSEPSRRPQPHFGGQGRRLGTDDVPAPAPVESSSHSAPDHTKRVEKCLKLWRNGFSVDDGPLRAYDDPANAQFLASIKLGQIPSELVAHARGGEVSLNMEDHRIEEYREPPKIRTPFSGSGFRLGNPTPETEDGPSSAPSSGGDPKKDEEAAQTELNVDTSQPTTTIQVRLADSSRLVIRLNLTHSVGRIREYICRARPTYGARPFVLMTTFPNKELSDESATIAEANLQNASVVQRMK
jgi:UBX domain-containing protein 1